jgi:hypothetical protein
MPLWNFGTWQRNTQDSRKEHIKTQRLTCAASPRVDISSTCKVRQKLGVSLPLLASPPLVMTIRLLYRSSEIPKGLTNYPVWSRYMMHHTGRYKERIWDTLLSAVPALVRKAPFSRDFLLGNLFRDSIQCGQVPVLLSSITTPFTIN